MVLENNIVLITGGSSGIGLELARQLVERKNKVIICGRSEDKLSKAAQCIPGLITFQCDLSEENECIKLAEWIKQKFPKCNILINNAAIVHNSNFYDDELTIDEIQKEININLVAPIKLCKFFIPIIEQNPNPKIVNITTGLVYAPRATYPIYNATKAGLHAFTQVLRIQIKHFKVGIIEVLFPAVDTPWHKGNVPKIAILPQDAVKEMLRKLEKGQIEIKVGKVNLLYWLSRLAPKVALRMMNRIN